MKAHTTVCIDAEILRHAREKRINVSAVLEDALKGRYVVDGYQQLAARPKVDEKTEAEILNNQWNEIFTKYIHDEPRRTILNGAWKEAQIKGNFQRWNKPFRETPKWMTMALQIAARRLEKYDNFERIKAMGKEEKDEQRTILTRKNKKCREAK